ncbi:GGDEF domain-containing protein [Candidatus Woesearchaeota archaeon]|nr:MAG: GGDEF domain-containing protein [Candidatus Woesearchaeota archaeon]
MKRFASEQGLPREIRRYIRELESINEQLRTQREKLAKLVVLDELTGAYNRRGFTWRLERAAQAAEDGDIANSFLVYFDLDGFKQVNDTYGHPVGDTVLRETAACLRSSLRETDLVARLGGDEFAAILYRVGPGPHELHEPPETLAQLQLLHATNAIEYLVSNYARDVVPEVMAKEGIEAFPISISAGLTRITAEPVQDLCARADAALLEAKARGKNRVASYGD